MEYENDPIPTISHLYIDLVKCCYEGIGYYLFDTNNPIEYRNYFAAQPSLGGNIDISSEDCDIKPGEYKKNPSSWNIANACSWITKNSYDHYIKGLCGHCAKNVRLAINAGFDKPISGYPRWAWQYIKYLPTIGFRFINLIDKSYNGVNGTYVPNQGDIAVYTKGGDTNVPGHICMWTGSKWVSDFKQSNVIVYSNTPKAYIFRFT